MSENSTIYKSSISNKLKPFISSLKKLISNYEEIVLNITKSLPKIESQIDDNVLEARELLNFIFSSGKNKKDYGVTKEINQFHRELGAALETLEKSETEDNKLFKSLKESIDVSSYTLNKTEEIKNISENLKVFAINSIVYSQKAGTQGKGYQIISGEFIRLSEAIAAGTETIKSIADDMYKQIDIFHDLVEKHEVFVKDNIQAISKNSGDLLNKANKSVESFSLILNDILTRVEKVKKPTYKIMTELQKQDIIQQQLEHLMESIEDILLIIENPAYTKNQENEGSGSDQTRDVYTLLGYLMITVENQIRRISNELYDMIDGMESMFEAMNSSISDINLDQEHFSQLVENEEEGKNVSIVDIIFKTPQDMINSVTENLKENLKRKENIIQSFGEIEEKVKQEKELALTFVPIIDSINNLLTLAKIEQARYNLNISSMKGVSGDGFFSKDIYSELENIVNEIENSYNAVSGNLANSNELYNIQADDYEIIQEKLNNSLKLIDKTRVLFLENFDVVINITNELFEHLEEHVGFFKTMRTLVNDITNKISICTEIKEIVEKKLEELGGPLKLEDCSFKDIIIQKYSK